MAKKTEEVTVSENTFRGIELSTRERISKEPRVMVFIAPDEKDPMWRGCINGVDYKFPKGEIIEVPESIADLIRNTTRMQEIKAAHEDRIKNLDLGSL